MNVQEEVREKMVRKYVEGQFEGIYMHELEPMNGNQHCILQVLDEITSSENFDAEYSDGTPAPMQSPSKRKSSIESRDISEVYIAGDSFRPARIHSLMAIKDEDDETGRDRGGILNFIKEFRCEINDNGTDPEEFNPKRPRVSEGNCKEDKIEAKAQVLQEKVAPKEKIHREIDTAQVLDSFNCQNGPDSIIMGPDELLISTLEPQDIRSDADIPLPMGAELIAVTGFDLPAEDVGETLQLLELYAACEKILKVKRGHAEVVLRELVTGLDFYGPLSVLSKKGKTIASVKLLDYCLGRDFNIDFSTYDKVLDALLAGGKTLKAFSILCKIKEKWGVSYQSLYLGRSPSMFTEIKVRTDDDHLVLELGVNFCFILFLPEFPR